MSALGNGLSGYGNGQMCVVCGKWFGIGESHSCWPQIAGGISGWPVQPEMTPILNELRQIRELLEKLAAK